jgi:hypothetical protein
LTGNSGALIPKTRENSDLRSGEFHFLSINGKLLDDPANEPPIDNFSYEVRAQALKRLRIFMVSNTYARIEAGAKRAGVEAAMPGIVEKVQFSLQCRQPLLFTGG